MARSGGANREREVGFRQAIPLLRKTSMSLMRSTKFPGIRGLGTPAAAILPSIMLLLQYKLNTDDGQDPSVASGPGEGF